MSKVGKKRMPLKYRVCRSCLGVDKELTTSCVNEEDQAHLIEHGSKIDYCFGKIRQDKYIAYKLCSDCTMLLQVCYNFKRQIYKSEQIFKQGLRRYVRNKNAIPITVSNLVVTYRTALPSGTVVVDVSKSTDRQENQLPVIDKVTGGGDDEDDDDDDMDDKDAIARRSDELINLSNVVAYELGEDDDDDDDMLKPNVSIKEELIERDVDDYDDGIKHEEIDLIDEVKYEPKVEPMDGVTVAPSGDPYRCVVCDEAQHDETRLLYHLKTHTNDTTTSGASYWRTCPICDKPFKVANMTSHLKKHIKDDRLRVT